MIRHIFKIIWNERKTNSWIVLEYVLVFCILWFCCDYLYYIGKSYFEPAGYDINYTYSIQLTETPLSGSETPTADEMNSYVLTLIERLKRYPGVEHVCISNASMPYSNSTSGISVLINSDTVPQGFRMRRVSSEFFDVFRIKLTKGQTFDWTDPANKNHMLITPDRNGIFGNINRSAYPVNEVYKIVNSNDKDINYTISGITEKLKSPFYFPYENSIFFPIDMQRLQILGENSIRIHPNAAKGFEERFKKDMKEQLNIGPYKFSSITPIKELQKTALLHSGITNNLNSIYSITSFLIINIFLGIIGTFWYRTESRRSDIGLRIALGSSKRKIKSFLYTETIILLLISAFIGINICINLGQTDLLTTLGIPKANHEQIGSGIEQYFINFGLTFLFLATISLFAVWYPAKQSSNMQPAEVLHEE